MLGLSYGEIFLLLGATAALIGPKDLPLIARTAGRFAGRAIGYVQMARGQFESVMQQSQVTQVHKELQETIAQLEAIRYEVRSISLLHPGPVTRKMDNSEVKATDGAISSPHVENMGQIKMEAFKENEVANAASVNLHGQAMMYAKFAETVTVKADECKGSGERDKHSESCSLLSILPVSAESAGLLPKPADETKGSDIVLEAILEAEVARNAKEFFSQPENQIPNE
ncbi:uncharacterized protein LOC144711734 [Wolffia australiana]